MTELELLVLNSIKKKYSCLDIMKSYNLTHEQLWNILFSLKCKGFSFLRKYHYSGKLFYEFSKLTSLDNSFNNQIIMSKSENTFTAVLISDTHFGGEHERLDILYKVYNLCAKLDIHIIIHCGDFVDSFVNEKATISDYMERQEEQVSEALRIYPYDPSIFNFICLGNHDINALSRGNLNLAMAFENKRHDLVPIGWNFGILKVKNDQILVGHKVNKRFAAMATEKVVLLGHKHKLGYEFNKYKVIINVPALDYYKKVILKLTLKMEKGVFVSGVIEEYSIGYGLTDINKSNEIKFELDNEGETRKRTL